MITYQLLAGLVVLATLMGCTPQRSVTNKKNSFATHEYQIESITYGSSELRQNSFLEWIQSIFRPPARPTTTTTPSPPQRECSDCTCGTLNTFHRIVGGQETEVHQYPWMAMLMSNGNFYCGASLINDLYVATAAHCVRGFNQGALSVRLLEHNRRNSSANKIDRRVVWLTVNERYSSRNYDSDIALLRLSEPIQINEMLRPVCLPVSDDDFTGKIAVVTGWGAVSEGGPSSDALQEVEVPVLSPEECRSSNYGSSRITDNMLCAGFEKGGKDSCQGDSGGPLHVAIENTSRYQLAGIVSWGEGCARPRSPGVYTRVNRFNEWIAERTRDACSCSAQIQEGTTEGSIQTTQTTTDA